MSILDDAIREHLELKRQHGADDSELKQLEDEAFGPAERPSAEQALPDPAAEAPTEFLTPSPEAAEEKEARREPSFGIADLQEAPEQAPPEEQPGPAEEPVPAEEEQPAMEHEVVPEEPAEPPPSSEHSTEERHAIAEHPTELYDVEGEIAASESRSPSDDELLEEEMLEPRLAPADPLAGLEDVDEDDVSVEVEARVEETAVEDDEEDDFFDEQRLSDELDQALEAPAPPAPSPGELESDPEDDEAEEDQDAEEDEDEDDLEEEDEELAEEDEPPTGDVLGGTPDFLEETPEDDQLWFEQKPPKDFDFDD